MENLSTAPSVASCLHEFQEVIALSNAERNEEATTLWEDQLGRFRVWSANIGAHQTGLSSLNYRLRDDSATKEQVIRLLTSLQAALHAAKAAFEGETEHYEIEQITFADDDASDTQRILDFVMEHIRCLFRMTMLVRKPMQRDFLRESNATERTAFYYFDIDILSTKYPSAQEELLVRLAQASSKRRSYLQYRSRHHAKLSLGLNVDPNAPQEALSETVPTTVDTANMPDGDDTNSLSAMSETSFVTSLLSESNSIVPSRPREALHNEPFECPYCYCIITASTMPVWIKHIFDDLRPYICTVIDCRTPNVSFSSRRRWQQHMERQHVSRSLYYDQCPLCGVHNSESRDWFRHVAHHLQEIALAALRPTSDEVEGSNSSSPSSTDEQASMGAQQDTSSEDEDLPRFQTKQNSLFAAEQLGEVFSRPPKLPPRGKITIYWKPSEHKAFVMNVLEYGSDWDTIAKRITSKTKKMLQDFYHQEVQKGSYGEALERITKTADIRRGRETEIVLRNPVSSVRCQIPGCDRSFKDGLSLMAHAFKQHSAVKHVDLWSLDEVNGRILYNGKEPDYFDTEYSSYAASMEPLLYNSSARREAEARERIKLSRLAPENRGPMNHFLSSQSLSTLGISSPPIPPKPAALSESLNIGSTSTSSQRSPLQSSSAQTVVRVAQSDSAESLDSEQVHGNRVAGKARFETLQMGVRTPAEAKTPDSGHNPSDVEDFHPPAGARVWKCCYCHTRRSMPIEAHHCFGCGHIYTPSCTWFNDHGRKVTAETDYWRGLPGQGRPRPPNWSPPIPPNEALHPPPLPPQTPIDPYGESLMLHVAKRVSREEVNREALEQEGMKYEIWPDYWNVAHPLNEQEIVRLKERTRDIRWKARRVLDERSDEEEDFTAMG